MPGNHNKKRLSLSCIHVVLPILPTEGLRRVTSLPVNHKDIMFYICNTFSFRLYNLYTCKRQSLLISEVQHNRTPEALCKGTAEGNRTCTLKGPKGQPLFLVEGLAGGSLSEGQRHRQQPCCVWQLQSWCWLVRLAAGKQPPAVPFAACDLHLHDTILP